MADNEQVSGQNGNPGFSKSGDDKAVKDPCPHCGAVGGASGSHSQAIEANKTSSSASATSAGSPSATSPEPAKSLMSDPIMASLASSTGSIPNATGDQEALSKWEQDTFRDIINNVNNTLRFQIQLAVPILAGCVTALNLVPPQEHQEFLNNYDRWVFFPVLLSMGASYYGLELHWAMQKGKPIDSHEGLSKLVKKKYFMVHLAIFMQALGLLLLFIFVLLEYK